MGGQKNVAKLKLRFYYTIKDGFGYEPYLDVDDVVSRKALSRIRSSAHDLKVETSRYIYPKERNLLS